jgi:hypothetical protein
MGRQMSADGGSAAISLGCRQKRMETTGKSVCVPLAFPPFPPPPQFICVRAQEGPLCWSLDFISSGKAVLIKGSFLLLGQTQPNK